MSNEYENKYAAAIAELKKSPISLSNYRPLLHMLFCKFGYKVKPPHYCSFLENFLLCGIFFVLFFGLATAPFMVLVGNSIYILVMNYLLAGACFGLCMGLYYKISAKKHNLTPWDVLSNV